MSLVEIFKIDKNQYNRFVIENEAGSFLQSWEWGGWQESLGRQIFRFWLKNDSGRNIGTVQLIKMPLPFGKFYLYAPYGPVFAKGENLQLIFNDLISNFPEAAFIRIEPKGSSLIVNHKALIKTLNVQPGKTLIVDLQKSEEELLAKMHPKTRYNIKLAKRHGVAVQNEFGITVDHGLYFQEAIGLLVTTGRRQNFSNYPRSYFEKLVDFFGHLNFQATAADTAIHSGQSAAVLKEQTKADAVHNPSQVNLHVYKVIYKNQLLASAIFLDFGRARTFLFGGSSEKDRNVMAPYALHWQAMLDAKAAGFKIYDFWGTETAKGDMPGFVRFKIGFGGAEKIYAGAYDLVSRAGIYRLYKMFRRLNRKLKNF